MSWLGTSGSEANDRAEQARNDKPSRTVALYDVIPLTLDEVHMHVTLSSEFGHHGH